METDPLLALAEKHREAMALKERVTRQEGVVDYEDWDMKKQLIVWEEGGKVRVGQPLTWTGEPYGSPISVRMYSGTTVQIEKMLGILVKRLLTEEDRKLLLKYLN